jgi:hypothetical protein
MTVLPRIAEKVHSAVLMVFAVERLMSMRLKRQAMLFCAGLLLTAAPPGGVFAPCSAQTARLKTCAPAVECRVSLSSRELSSIVATAETWPSRFFGEVERSFVDTIDRTYVRGVARTGAFLIRHVLFLE